MNSASLRLLGIVVLGWLGGHEAVKAQTPAPTGPVVESGTPAPATVPAEPGRESKPVWEVGIGGGFFSGFDYPASRDSNRRAIALPFFIYRSPRLRLGEGGLSAVAIENPKVKLDVSIGGSLNASSEGNRARVGMPDLDFLFEVGPQIEVQLINTPVPFADRFKARFTSELRAVFVTDFKRIATQGFVADIGLGANLRDVKNTGLDLFAALDVSFATEKLQDYFYEVAPRYVTERRPAFDAKGGYMQTRLFAGIGFKPHRQVRLFLGVFAGFYEGARNQQSPLFETTSHTGFAAGFVWSIKTSDKRVDVIDLGSSR